MFHAHEAFQIAVSWLLAGTLGIGGVSVGMIAGWILMIAYEGFMIKSSLNCRRQAAAYFSA
nr:hypothetical protein [uncultured Clostridium sp.]